MSAAPARRASPLRAAVRNPLTVAGLVLLAVTLTALAAAFVIGWVDPSGPAKANLHGLNAPPGTPGHLLGTDNGGRDVLIRLVAATKATMLGAAVALTVAVALGVPAGLVAGYRGGWAETALEWLAGLAMSLPSLMVLMAIIAGLGTSMWISMTALGCMMAPAVFRLVRAQVHAVRRELYIDAAKVAGLGDARIIARHVLRVVRAPVVLMVGVMSGVAVTVQTGLDFIGLGDPSTITWGRMLSEGFEALDTNRLLFVWPGLAMVSTVMSFLLLGNGVRDALQRADTATRPRGRDRSPASRPVPPAVPGPRPKPPRPDELLSVCDLVVGYPDGSGGLVEVVRGATLGLNAESTLGLVGESGSGKTQTAFALLDLLPRQATILSGEIRLDGVDLLSLPPAERERTVRRTIAYVPQEPMSNLDPAFTIGHQLTEPLRARGVGRAEARARARGLLARMGISDPDRVMRSYPHQISGGMAQRVLIAGAVATEPRILVADEPTTALDVTVQSEILDLLRGLQAEMRMAILLVTHDLGVVADLCDDVAVMRAGRVVETAPVDVFFRAPGHEHSRALLAAVPDEGHVRPDYDAEAASAAWDLAYARKTSASPDRSLGGAGR
ncbi:dipeptide/oligopeptide/nickel ABC transporter permease/ATP-binding protein [Actinomadura violacea]|uniref:Dipeptide/oligopeptide/nickel ABC transporter permease/ATP-binding protein n=1 Tax=Actinomadura violacea TaxID=2819934 RepID=A0ABS3S8T7_9ACTN|nr:dipeptide/oligopeptide/nickel ABC transporter permease/ATP-binding protein [Actinomadura violacea]MBO2465425.1 dipeptide/oligopeptide/nickel ABC transporter permease/ATP-binding protein [Actinomadura violacea]